MLFFRVRFGLDRMFIGIANDPSNAGGNALFVGHTGNGGAAVLFPGRGGIQGVVDFCVGSFDLMHGEEFNKMYEAESAKPDDKFTFVYCERDGQRDYVAGSAGRIRIADARFMVDAMNEYSLCIGEGK